MNLPIKLFLKGLTWEEASEMINKSGRDQESIEYNIKKTTYEKFNTTPKRKQ